MELHDRGTDRLLADLARAELVRDVVEITDAARAAAGQDMTLADAEAALTRHTRLFTIRLERAWQTHGNPRTTEWSVCCCRTGGQQFSIFASTRLRAAVVQAIGHLCEANVPDLAEVSGQVERFDEFTGPMGGVE